MLVWVRYVQRSSDLLNYKTLATVQMDAQLIPQMGDQVGIDHRAYQVTERVYPNVSSHAQGSALDPEVVHIYLGVVPMEDHLRSFDPNVF